MAQIRLRRGTAAEWSAANPILASGELGVDLTLAKIKLGDGIHTWSALDTVDGEALALIGSHDHAGLYEPLLTPASQGEMQVGTESALRSMSPLRVAQAIAALAGGGGDMYTLVYDPRGIAEDAFDLGNLTGNLDGGTF